LGRADALLVNLGTFDADRREATDVALEVAAERRIPWVLDPVLIDRSEARADYAKSLLAQKPRAVRLNAAEFTALDRTLKPASSVTARCRRRATAS
jgi:hydroxyethylthiazole kinase